MKEYRLNAEQIAEVIHRATSHIPRIDGSLPALWVDLTEDQRHNAANAVKEIYANPMRSASELHELWMKPLLEDGWTEGPFSVENKTHPSLIHFDYLPDSEVLKDLLWEHMIEAFRRFYTPNDEEADELY